MHDDSISARKLLPSGLWLHRSRVIWPDGMVRNGRPWSRGRRGRNEVYSQNLRFLSRWVCHDRSDQCAGNLQGRRAHSGAMRTVGRQHAGSLRVLSGRIYRDRPFQRAPILLHGSRQRIHSNRPAVELLDDRQKNLPIHLIEAGGIDRQPCQRLLSHRLGDAALGLDLSIVPDPLDQPVHDARSPARPAGNFSGAGPVDRNIQQPSRSRDDGRQFLRRIKLLESPRLSLQ